MADTESETKSADAPKKTKKAASAPAPSATNM
jgi:hypothetical protein